MIVSASGVRGIPNQDVTVRQLAEFARSFYDSVESDRIIIARDTRRTGGLLTKGVAAALLSRGATILDAGVVSTPALFRETRLRGLPGIMVTASHNEPEFNGLKFVDAGFGVPADRVGAPGEAAGASPFAEGRLKRLPRTSYADDLASLFGRGSCAGVRVAVDLGGGAAIAHAEGLLKALGCEVEAMSDSYGVFSRRVDPVNDDLALLRGVVKEKGCDVGLAFDCDGDRLAIVDCKGNKRTGDYMLSLALSSRLREVGERKVVVSVDTTQAIDEVAAAAGAQVFRAKVGEANVVGKMKEVGATIGGEGSSGGLIDGSFNWCRDSMLAAITIIASLKTQGRSVYESVRSYHLARAALQLPRTRASSAIKAMAKSASGLDSTDGVKIRVSRKSWVLIRRSGTEDVVRVSAEAETAAEAERLVANYSKRLKR